MTRKAKGLGADPAQALKKAHITSDNSTADQAAVVIPGFKLLDQEGCEVARSLIRAAMSLKDPLGTVRVNQESTSAEFHAILLDINTGRHEFGLLLFGFEPGNRFTAAELHDAFNQIYNGDPDTDAVISDLSNRREAKTLLTDFSLCREAAEGMLGERHSRDAICTRFMEALQDPACWTGTIPGHALIYASQPRPIGEVAP